MKKQTTTTTTTTTITKEFVHYQTKKKKQDKKYRQLPHGFFHHFIQAAEENVSDREREISKLQQRVVGLEKCVKALQKTTETGEANGLENGKVRVCVEVNVCI